MRTEDHNDAPCAALPHVVGTITIVRCGHRESYSGTMWCVLDDGQVPMDDVAGERIEFGPFDTEQEIAAWAANVATRMVRAMGRHELA